MEPKFKEFQINIKSVDTDKHMLEAVFSSPTEDRHGDIVLQNFDLKNFKKNPVLVNSHNYGDATEVVGKISNLSTKSGNLEGKAKFAVAENPKAKVIFDLYAGGYLSAFSIGFIPKEFSEDGRTIIRSELLEISTVSVPANALALAKSKGIDTSALDGKEPDSKDEPEDDIKPDTQDTAKNGAETTKKHKPLTKHQKYVRNLRRINAEASSKRLKRKKLLDSAVEVMHELYGESKSSDTTSDRARAKKRLKKKIIRDLIKLKS